MSFGRSFSVGGGVRKLGLGVAGTGGAISTDTLGCGISAGPCGIFPSSILDKLPYDLLNNVEQHANIDHNNDVDNQVNPGLATV